MVFAESSAFGAEGDGETLRAGYVQCYHGRQPQVVFWSVEGVVIPLDVMDKILAKGREMHQKRLRASRDAARAK